jgi:hypothetical protein
VDDGEDWRIRAYTKCPVYDRALSKFYTSGEFKDKEVQTQPVRDAVAAISPALNTSLANWWNVFDAFNVQRTYGVGDPMPPIDDSTYQQVRPWGLPGAHAGGTRHPARHGNWEPKACGHGHPSIAQVIDVANWLETAKMRSNITQNMLGGALLADILVRMDNANKAVSDGKPVSKVLTSPQSSRSDMMRATSCTLIPRVRSLMASWLAPRSTTSC